jgi:hypothetical protein
MAKQKNQTEVEDVYPRPEQAKANRGLIDAREAWDAEAGGNASPLVEIRLSKDETLVVPFTTKVASVKIHFLDVPAVRGYVLCGGSNCLLCRLGRRSDERHLLPVYDPIGRNIGVLPISPSMRPSALRPALRPVLDAIGGEKGLLVKIRKLDMGRFAVSWGELPRNADDGATIIASFLKGVNDGSVDLTTIYPSMTNKDLSQIPELKTLMGLQGVNDD